MLSEDSVLASWKAAKYVGGRVTAPRPEMNTSGHATIPARTNMMAAPFFCLDTLIRIESQIPNQNILG